MADTGTIAPTGDVFISGNPTKYEKNVDVATDVYPGRILIRGTTDDGVKASDGVTPIAGFAGYGGEEPPAAITDIYTVNKRIPVYSTNGAARWQIPSGLAAGTVATKDDPLFSWSNGRVVPGMYINGMPAIKIPFSKQTSEYDTGIDLPAGIVVKDVIVRCTTAASGATIDVGILSTESGGDADGFVDGESLAATGLVAHNMVDATAANNTLGALLVESDIKTADATALYFSVPLFPGYKTDGTAKSITYTTSNHTVAGYFYVVLSSQGIQEVGKTVYTVDASSAAATIQVEAK